MWIIVYAPIYFQWGVCIIYTHLDKHRSAPVKCNKCSFVILKKKKSFDGFLPFILKACAWITSMQQKRSGATSFRFFFVFVFVCVCVVCVLFSSSTSPSFVLFSFDSFALFSFFFKHPGIMSKRKLSMKIEMRIHYIFAVAAVERRHSKLPFAQWDDNNLLTKNQTMQAITRLKS